MNTKLVRRIQMRDTEKKMIEEFQCPGCVCGSDTTCEAFTFYGAGLEFTCDGHVPGTMFAPGGVICLGLPKGFNKVGEVAHGYRSPDGKRFQHIRLWEEKKPDWNHLNVPVWAMEKDGYLFVRTYLPRLNLAYVDVVKDGKLDMVPNAIDVGKFYEEID